MMLLSSLDERSEGVSYNPEEGFNRINSCGFGQYIRDVPPEQWGATPAE